MFNERELLDARVEPTTPLKEYIVDYVGNKIDSTTDTDSLDVTVEMIIHVLTEDFPEIVLALAEENFIRGYEQGLSDQGIAEEVSLGEDTDNDIN
ncbi:hypothetical protein CMI37_23800 [Candidatus Pacearchaeota archaeon]|nr:hypothetical protein [Candidatus Pacearchaeota archaeon]|tara:strand:- start:4316 stop:4600 length:285 start_codon:yes stop_codon:yes gene_type:complete